MCARQFASSDAPGPGRNTGMTRRASVAFRRYVRAGVLVAALAPAAAAQPANDACANAVVVRVGDVVAGTVLGATSDGTTACSPAGVNVPDVYYRFTPITAGLYTFSLCGGTAWDTVISVHRFCPANPGGEVDCDDEGCTPPGGVLGQPSRLTTFLAPGQEYLVRVSGYDLGAALGDFVLSVTGPGPGVGACCLGTDCSLQTAQVCGVAGATYFGDLSTCLAPQRNLSSTVAPNLPGVIPDNAPAGLTRDFTVASSFTVAEVRLTLSIQHTWVGDLTITLEHAGRTATVIQRVRGGIAGSPVNLNGVYTFTDGAMRTFWNTPEVISSTNTAAEIPAGDYWASDASGAALGLSQVFAGVDAAGVWTLRVVDAGPSDIGQVLSATLTLDPALGNICTTPPPPVGACCTGATVQGVGTTCTLAGQATCGTQNGTYRGDGTMCGPNPSTPIACCGANFNQQGAVTVQDIFDYLTAWFAGQPGANFNGQGGVTVQDIFDYLTAWFVGCRIV